MASKSTINKNVESQFLLKQSELGIYHMVTYMYHSKHVYEFPPFDITNFITLSYSTTKYYTDSKRDFYSLFEWSLVLIDVSNRFPHNC